MQKLLQTYSMMIIRFIFMDDNEALFDAFQGNTMEVLHKFMVYLPKKHGRVG